MKKAKQLMITPTSINIMGNTHASAAHRCKLYSKYYEL